MQTSKIGKVKLFILLNDINFIPCDMHVKREKDSNVLIMKANSSKCTYELT